MQGCGHEWMEDERGGDDIPKWVRRLQKRRWGAAACAQGCADRTGGVRERAGLSHAIGETCESHQEPR